MLHTTLWRQVSSSSSLSSLSSLTHIRGIVLHLLSTSSSPQGVCTVLSLASGTVFISSSFTFEQFVADVSTLMTINDTTRLGVFMYCKNLLFNKVIGCNNDDNTDRPVQVTHEQHQLLLASVGPGAIDTLYGGDGGHAKTTSTDAELSINALILIGVAAGKDPSRLLTYYLKLLCDTIDVNGKDQTLKQITLNVLRLHGNAFKNSVQTLSGTQQSVLQSFLKETMQEEALRKEQQQTQQNSFSKKKKKKKKKKKLKL